MPVEMTEDHIHRFLAEQSIGRLGLIDDGEPYVVPISYAYRDGRVYCHSAQGRKVRALRSRSPVCFEVDQVKDLSTWTSVIAWGDFEQVTGVAAQEALNLLLDKFTPESSSRSGMAHPGAELGMMRTLNIPRVSADADLARPSSAGVVFQITLHRMSGQTETPTPAA